MSSACNHHCSGRRAWVGIASAAVRRAHAPSSPFPHCTHSAAAMTPLDPALSYLMQARGAWSLWAVVAACCVALRAELLIMTKRSPPPVPTAAPPQAGHPWLQALT